MVRKKKATIKRRQLKEKLLRKEGKRRKLQGKRRLHMFLSALENKIKYGSGTY